MDDFEMDLASAIEIITTNKVEWTLQSPIARQFVQVNFTSPNAVGYLMDRDWVIEASLYPERLVPIDGMETIIHRVEVDGDSFDNVMIKLATWVLAQQSLSYSTSEYE